MNTCWKCGAETTNTDPECDACRDGIGPRAIEDQVKFHEIDWTKVRTVEDYRTVLRHTFSRIAIPENHPHFETLKKYL